MSTIRASKTAAFTLIELLSVIGVMAILIAFATVGIGDGGRAQRLTSSGNRVADLVNLARTTAKTRNSMSMLVVAKKGEFAYRALAVLEKPLESSQWKQITPWEMLPDGVGVIEAESASFLTTPIASLSPAPPALRLRGANLPASDYAWQVFLPTGRLLSEQPTPPMLYLSSEAEGADAQNFYSITINANTGIPIVRRP